MLFNDIHLDFTFKQAEIEKSRREICLLSFLNGIIITIKAYGLREDLAPTIEYGLELCKDVIDNYPEEGNVQMNFLWIKGKVDKAQEFLGEDSGNLYTAVVLANLGNHMINDMVLKVKGSPKKLEHLEPLEELFSGLCEQLDPEGEQFEAYEEAESHLKKIYDLIGFSV